MTATRGRHVRQQWAEPAFGWNGWATLTPTPFDAFVPAPIADVQLRLSGPTVVADAERELARLEAYAGNTPGLAEMSRLLLRSETVASSWMGALPVSQRQLAAAALDVDSAPGEAGHLSAMLDAVGQAIALGAAADPFTADTLAGMHSLVTSGHLRSPTDDEPERPRTTSAFVGGLSPATAEYVGPPAQHVAALLDDLALFIAGRPDLPVVVVAALAHAQTLSVLPFADGNGRLARCLVHALLRRRGLSAAVLVPLSVIVASRRRRGVNAVQVFRADDLDGCVSDFGSGLTITCAAVRALAHEVYALRRHWEDRLDAARDTAPGRHRPRRSAAIVRLLALLPGRPTITTQQAANALDVNWTTAQRAIDGLVPLEILQVDTTLRRCRVYHAPDAYTLLERFERDPEAFVRAATP